MSLTGPHGGRPTPRRSRRAGQRNQCPPTLECADTAPTPPNASASDPPMPSHQLAPPRRREHRAPRHRPRTSPHRRSPAQSCSTTLPPRPAPASPSRRCRQTRSYMPVTRSTSSPPENTTSSCRPRACALPPSAAFTPGCTSCPAPDIRQRKRTLTASALWWPKPSTTARPVDRSQGGTRTKGVAGPLAGDRPRRNAVRVRTR